jgi:hypothetical protein
VPISVSASYPSNGVLQQPSPLHTDQPKIVRQSGRICAGATTSRAGDSMLRPWKHRADYSNISIERERFYPTIQFKQSSARGMNPKRRFVATE